MNNKYKHLTLENRIFIQQSLDADKTFSFIAKELKKDPSTISKEIRKHLKLRSSISSTYHSSGQLVSHLCPNLLKPPYVCNACSKRRYCKLDRKFYEARFAHQSYLQTLSDSREGIILNKESFYELDRILSADIEKGQHLYHAAKSNSISVPISTLYRYFDKGYFSASVTKLPRKLKFKPKKSSYLPSVPKGVRLHRSYEDFLSFLSQNSLSSWVEMDTLIGTPGGKTILTLHFTFCNFMIGRLLPSKSAKDVAAQFLFLRALFADHDFSFSDLFPVILTDNGGEFSDVFSIENNLHGKKETHLFFCNPMQSAQKPRVEKNHTLFRDICPKGSSFNDFTQEDVNLIFSHINSVLRKSLNGKSAYDVFSFTYGQKITSLLGISKIPCKEVIQSPLLLRRTEL